MSLSNDRRKTEDMTTNMLVSLSEQVAWVEGIERGGRVLGGICDCCLVDDGGNDYYLYCFTFY